MTSTELGYLSGVTSNIQTQLDGKVNRFFCMCESSGTTKSLTIINGPNSLKVGDIIDVYFSYAAKSIPNMKLQLVVNGTTYTLSVLLPYDGGVITPIYPYSYYLWRGNCYVSFTVLSTAKCMINDNSNLRYSRKLLLWENLYPELNFAAQDITIASNINYFSDIEIVYAKNPNLEGKANYTSSGVIPLNVIYSELSCIYRNSSGGQFRAYRYFDIDTTTTTGSLILKFYDAVTTSASVSTSGTVANNCMIPYRIYGIMNTDNTELYTYNPASSS